MNFLEVINIASKFDAKGFKQAETALGKLANTTKKLAGAAGIAYGAAAITAYGKAAVKAFAQDEAAAVRLNRAVTNLGIGFANPAIADYIGKLEKSAAIADDILRPAFQSLLTTTGSLTKSQELLNNAITISRASGIDLATVSEDLAKGYVGITKGLAKYNTGLTRSELNTKSFSEILGVLLTRSAGAAEDYLGSTAYSMNVLSIATGNASEIIGKGLVDAFAAIGGGSEASDAAIAIEGVAKAIAGIIKVTGTALGGITNVFTTLKNLPKNVFMGFAGAQTGVNLGATGATKPKLTVSQLQQQKLLDALEAAAIKRNKELLALKNKQLAIEKQTLSQKKLQAAIDKANLALGKGSEIFDMDKIQIAAALTNQAEQLGKATTGAQVLQIANDIARLNVKRDILALEDAIAAKDEAAIVAATNKLNADLKILGTLGQQNVKLLDIKSILDSLVPKDLINLQNLKDALGLLGQINLASTGSKTTPAGQPTSAPSTAALTPATTIAETNANVASLGGIISSIGSNLIETTLPSIVQTIIQPNMREFSSSYIPNITINTGVGDPNAIAEAITQVIQDAVDRGTLRGGSY